MTTPSIPSHMKGIIIESAGGVEVLQYKTDTPVPVPKDGEVLIKNDFIGVNYVEINFRTGRYPVPKPHILGSEAEGTIVSTSSEGELHGLKAGDRVVWIGSGAYAEYSTCSAAKVYVLPAELESGVAAASLAQGMTALALSRKSYHVQKGDWILVQGASSGVGLWFCRLLREFGAKVIGTASTEEKMKLGMENGAEVMLNYTTDDVVARVMEATNGTGVAAVFDSIGAATFEQGLQSLARDGTMVSYGNTSGAVPPFEITKLTPKNLKVLKPSLFGYIQTREDFVGYAEELFQYIKKNGVDGTSRKVYPLAEVAKAHTDLEERRTSGKLLLKT